MYAIASGVLGGYLVTKSFGAALGTYINEFTISAKIEYNAITGVTQLSQVLVFSSLIMTVISISVQSIVLRKELNEKVKLDEEFGYKMTSEA